MNRNILLVMSFSGSVLSITWFIICKLYFLEFKAKWLHNLFLLVIPFYLFPFPLFKYYLHDILIYLGLRSSPLLENLEGSVDKTYIVVDLQTEFLISFWEKILLLSMGIMALITILYILLHINRYIYLRNLINRCVKQPLTARERKQFDQIKGQLRIKKKITLIKSPDILTPFTVGAIYPVVAIPVDLPPTKQAFQMILKHELVHIKHRDALLNLIACGILCLHWFNPMCYLLLSALKKANELYCDEDVTASMTMDEKSAYCSLLIELSERSDPKRSLFTFNFIGNNKTQMKRRIDNIMNGKKNKFGMAVILGSVMLNLGVCSTFVYANVGEMEVTAQENYSLEDEEKFHTELSDLSSDTVIVDDFFTDDDGNIYPCDNGIETRVLCNHTYVNGTRTVHKKNGKGCTMDYYHAKRCTKCGKIVSYDLYYTGTWVTCPH